VAKKINNFMGERKNFSSDAPWESFAGYSRAVRIGKTIEVAGTTAVDSNGQIVYPGDVGAQTKFIFEKIDKILIEAGSKLSDVIRTRMFVTDINDWEKIAIAHGYIFNEIKPVSTLVEVSQLIDKELLIEIEVSAIIQN
tara:strand:+ start:1532 stop:1948 length:417 start_codon:yes stop_codon:yes gene_type:complete